MAMAGRFDVGSARNVVLGIGKVNPALFGVEPEGTHNPGKLLRHAKVSVRDPAEGACQRSGPAERRIGLL